MANDRQATGIRKAALFVAGLDQTVADRLLEQMGPERARQVREAMRTIDAIDLQEQQRVIDEFQRIEPMIPPQSPAGIELDKLSIDQARHDFAAELDAPASSGTTVQDATPPAPFEFLRDADDPRLAELLSTERPQTIALVLSHLPPERAGATLAHFDPSLQVEVVRRLVDLENTDPETLRQIERTLEERLARQIVASRRERANGPQTVARILAACGGATAGEIVDHLAQFDPSLAEMLGYQPLEFDDLAQLDDALLTATFQATDPDVAMAALLGATPTLVERVLGGLAPEQAKQWRRRLERPEPIRLSDIDAARRQVAATARHLSFSVSHDARAA
ncbi:MAG: FliG C-terminal domain-containing protein [Thermoguttaceae bacterium]